MRYDVTFYFNTETEAVEVKKFFKGKGKELNSEKLYGMVLDV